MLNSNRSYINEEKNENIMDIAENLHYNNNNKNWLSKDNLLKKISNMKNEFEKEKKGKSIFNTMKAINNENYKMYNLIKFDISRVYIHPYINSIINYVILIKDLLYALKYEKEELLDSDKSPLQKQNINEICEKYFGKINCFLDLLKKKKQNVKPKDLGHLVHFLLDNVEKTIKKCDIINKYLNEKKNDMILFKIII